MEKINKYWYIQWWCSFSKLDTKSHDLAVEQIWECMTSNASIHYHKPLLMEEKEDLHYNFKIISKSKSSALIQWQISKKIDWKLEECVTGMFTFVKIKKF